MFVRFIAELALRIAVANDLFRMSNRQLSLSYVLISFSLSSPPAHSLSLQGPDPLQHAHTWSLAEADRREVLLTRGGRVEGKHTAYVTSRQMKRYSVKG